METFLPPLIIVGAMLAALIIIAFFVWCLNKLLNVNPFDLTPEQRHRNKMESRFYDMKEYIGNMLHDFEVVDPYNEVNIKIFDPETKAVTESGQPIEYGDTIKITLTSGRHIDKLTSTLTLNLNDPRFKDDEECVNESVRMIHDLIITHMDTYKRQRHTQF